MRGLKGKNVLITGSTSGIGQAIAVRFACEGANVAVNYRKQPEDARKTEEMLRQCIQKEGRQEVQYILVQGDVSSEESVHAMFRETTEKLGGIDILVNNAGIQTLAPTEKTALKDVDKVLEVNLKGAFLCARSAINHFLDENKAGAIINISSVHQAIPKPRYIGYAMSKGGMQNLTRTLALEYAHKNIRVNAIGPGATITPMNKSWSENPEKKRRMAEHIPMGRPAEADEMGAVATFLASDDASYITGQTLFVDGGISLYPDFQPPR